MCESNDVFSFLVLFLFFFLLFSSLSSFCGVFISASEDQDLFLTVFSLWVFVFSWVF